MCCLVEQLVQPQDAFKQVRHEMCTRDLDKPQPRSQNLSLFELYVHIA